MLNPQRQAFADACVDLATAGSASARALLEALPAAIYTTDADGYLTFYNAAAAELWGHQPKLGEARYTGGYKLLAADGSPKSKADGALGCSLRERRQIRGVEGMIERPDGTRVHVLPFPTLLFDPAGKLTGAVNMVVDITERKRAEQRLRDSEAHYRHFLEVSPGLFWTADPHGSVTVASDTDAALLGTVTDLPDLSGYGSRVHPDDREATERASRHALATGDTLDHVCRFRMANGRYRWVRARAHAQRDAEGRIQRWYGSTEDIHRQKLAEAALATAQERLTLALDGNRVGVWDWAIAQGRLWLSDSAYVLQGYRGGELPGSELMLDAVVHPDDRVKPMHLLRDAMRGDIDRFVSEHRIRTKSGAWIWVVDRGKVVERDGAGHAVRMVGTRTDVTDRKHAEERVRWMAGHDPLTGLPNRRLFQDELSTQIANAGPSGRQVGLLLLDLDDFKDTNDNLGHDAGDALLRDLADRLSMGTDGFAARLGGDEFAIVLPDVAGEAGVRDAMAMVHDRLREPLIHGGRSLECRASIGASLYPAHGDDPDELLKSADLALYVAKSRGNSAAALFEPGMRSAVQARAAMVRSARIAADAGRIEPFYQPKVALSSGRIAGFEALLRWRDRRGLRTPEAIAAAFDDLTTAKALSDCMLGKVIDDMRGWLDAGIEFGHVAINASPAEFRSGDLADRVLSKLDAAGIHPARLELEVTETVFIGRGADHVERALTQLSQAGVRIALDDFGTGYASLTHLKQFPVDIIKVDRSFVRDLEDDPYDAAIVRAVLNLGESLKVDIVAEGIETPAQAAYLWAQGCGFGQGFLFSKPTAGPKIPKLIADWSPSRRWRASL
jgi:diguanylate cyclase (GGDEF)-like protein/PAS domain S-box-containing protein